MSSKKYDTGRATKWITVQDLDFNPTQEISQTTFPKSTYDWLVKEWCIRYINKRISKNYEVWCQKIRVYNHNKELVLDPDHFTFYTKFKCFLSNDKTKIHQILLHKDNLGNAFTQGLDNSLMELEKNVAGLDLKSVLNDQKTTSITDTLKMPSKPPKILPKSFQNSSQNRQKST